MEISDFQFPAEATTAANNTSLEISKEEWNNMPTLHSQIK